MPRRRPIDLQALQKQAVAYAQEYIGNTPLGLPTLALKEAK